MRTRVLALVIAAVISLGFAPAPLPKQSRDGGEREKAETLYASLGGLWRADEARSPLSGLWLHRNEKADVRDGRPPWRLDLSFDGAPQERFEGAPERVEAERGALKVVLPPADTRGTHLLRIYRDGDRVKVRVVGGPCEGVYALKKARAKH
jgi:hypothetical protein